MATLNSYDNTHIDRCPAKAVFLDAVLEGRVHIHGHSPISRSTATAFPPPIFGRLARSFAETRNKSQGCAVTERQMDAVFALLAL